MWLRWQRDVSGPKCSEVVRFGGIFCMCLFTSFMFCSFSIGSVVCHIEMLNNQLSFSDFSCRDLQQRQLSEAWNCVRCWRLVHPNFATNESRLNVGTEVLVDRVGLDEEARRSFLS